MTTVQIILDISKNCCRIAWALHSGECLSGEPIKYVILLPISATLKNTISSNAIFRKCLKRAYVNKMKKEAQRAKVASVLFEFTMEFGYRFFLSANET